MNENSSADALIEQFLLLSMEQTEAAAVVKDKKDQKDIIADRLIPFVEETADDGQSYEVVREGKVIGKLNIQQSTSYTLTEGVTYDDLVQNGLMERRKSTFLRFYPAKPKAAKKAKEAKEDGDGLTDEVV